MDNSSFSDLLKNDISFEIFHFIVFFACTVFLFYYGYLVIHCSSKNMKIFKISMLIYIGSNFLVESIIILWKPVRIFPYSIIYPTGLLSPMSAELSGIFIMLMMLSIAFMMESLFVILLERHFQIAKVIYSRFSSIRNTVYAIQFTSFFLACLAAIILTADSIDAERTRTFIKNENMQILLAKQPSILMLKYSWNFLALYGIITVSFYAFYHLSLLGWLLYSNITYSKNLKINPSKQSKKQFSLMLQTTVAQTLTLLTFGLPFLIWQGTLLLPETPKSLTEISTYLEALASLFPIFDVIVVVLVVKPYREATAKLLFTKKLLPQNGVKFIVKSSVARNSLPQRSLSIINGRVNHI